MLVMLNMLMKTLNSVPTVDFLEKEDRPTETVIKDDSTKDSTVVKKTRVKVADVDFPDSTKRAIQNELEKLASRPMERQNAFEKMLTDYKNSILSALKQNHSELAISKVINNAMKNAGKELGLAIVRAYVKKVAKKAGWDRKKFLKEQARK